MEHSADVDLSVKQFFDIDAWGRMSDFEKRCYSNKKRNYEFFLKIGLNPQKPEFMKSLRNSSNNCNLQALDDSKLGEKQVSKSSRKNSSEKNLKVDDDIQLTVSKTNNFSFGSCQAGSGIFSNTPGKDDKISIRNSDHCSVFRSELIAISGTLDHALISNNDIFWILTDSRSFIQLLKNLPKIMDSTGLDILSNLARLGQRK
ncbi:KRAB-related domain-containing protein [Trichonephila clavipes]|nr:KRAB-related domain-containing protein [Trichonephila clavipes]